MMKPDEKDEDELEETEYIGVARGHMLESIVERGGKFWVCTSLCDFGPYDSFEDALDEPVDGPVNILTGDVTEVWSDRLNTEQLIEIFWVFEPDDTPYTITINDESFEVLGEEIVRKAKTPPAEDES